MIGLTYGDPRLLLLYRQKILLALHSAIMIFFWLYDWPVLVSLPIIAVIYGGLLFESNLSLDAICFLREVREVRKCTWSEFLNTLHTRRYLEYQTPFLPWVYAHYLPPQILPYSMICLAVLTALCCLVLYGQTACLLLATPLWCVMAVQPLIEIPLGLVLLCSLGFYRAEMYVLAAIFYGISYLTKPLTLVTLPVMAYYLGGYILISLFIWGIYLAWSIRYNFGRTQIDFLFHQAGVRCMPCFTRLFNENRRRKGKPPVKWYRWIFQNLLYKFNMQMKPTVPALFVYLAPAVFLLPISWEFLSIAGLITIGSCNAKYFWIALLFLPSLI